MSIIHDALKKLQQEKAKTETPAAQAPAANSGYIYAQQESTPQLQEPVEHLPSTKNNAKSLLALIGSVALIIGAFIFLFKQLNIYIPNFTNLETSVKTSFLKLIHKDAPPPPPAAVPLAKIVVEAPKAATPQASAPAVSAEGGSTSGGKPPVTIAGINLPAMINKALPTATPPPPETLNVHGVMSNGSGNIALINDQVYQEGDTVDGVKIVKISLNSIVVDNNGKEETIPVKN